MSEAAPQPAPATLGGLLRSHRWTLGACVLFAVLGALPGYNIFAGLIAVPLLPWLLYNLLRLVIRPRERRWRALRLVFWLAAFAVIICAQKYNDYAARRQADLVLARAQAHHARTGAWPRKLEDMGLQSAAMRAQWRLYYAAPPDGEPSLFYKSPSLIFDTWFYDFKTGSWEYTPD